MHPALQIAELTGLEREVYAVLNRHGHKGLSQTRIIGHLGAGAPTQSTISRALASLANKGIVAKSGSTRNASFSLSDEARWFSIPGHIRPPVAYDRNRFLAYNPNETPWLDAEARDRMVAAAGTLHPLDPSTYSHEIAERFMIEMSWASSALEGNTYSLLDTEVLIKYAEAAGGKSAEEATMILNHKNAIGWLIDNIATVDVTPEVAERLHAMLMRGMVRHENLGAVRQTPVNITTSSYQPSADRFELQAGLGELCHRAREATDPFEASFALLIGTAYLQAFIDGNKRTGRLLCNIPLLKAGLPPISFIGVDRRRYGIGMTTWYELSDPSYIASEIADAYAVSAPSYLVATATKRIVRSVEIRVRKQFDQALADYIAAFLDGDRTSADEFARTRFAALSPEDLAIIIESFESVLASIDDIKARAYGLDPAVVAAFQTARGTFTP